MADLGNVLSVTSGLAEKARSAAEVAATRNEAARAKAAQDFEGMLVSILLKQMRQTIGGDGLFAGENSDAYGGLFDLYMGEHIARSGGLGIAGMIEAYLPKVETE